MEFIFAKIGECFCYIGGSILALMILGLFAYFMCGLWINLSNKIRGICKAESMIFEYKKNREDFLKWMEDGKQ